MMPGLFRQHELIMVEPVDPRIVGLGVTPVR